ncbi:MAG: GGDEF domain-containing protein [Proteobacteria bacterium]|nr:GGDEF domain-containing protein [Pseudomonadota bacterium]MBU1688816.1 GGDEF domain-containing protein [Pseudomonadota bacterium]
MSSGEEFQKSLDDITSSLRTFIELSVKGDDKSWSQWISSVAREIEIRCWQQNRCANSDCPAYRSECGRCWLISSTLCSETHPNGKNRTSCCDCEIYLANIGKDPISEIQEQIITLVHSLRIKQMELKEMATQDPLTGLKNRHFFDLYIPLEAKKIQRTKETMSIIMIDVNDFKFINDTCGHLYGDHILQECAGILSHSIRASDILFRFGGDEFVIVMTKAGDHETTILQERIYHNLADWNTNNKNEQTPISFSIGHAILQAEDDLMTVINEADNRMYADKKQYKTTKESLFKGIKPDSIMH